MGWSILVVDGDPSVRWLARGSLEGAGYSVRTFASYDAIAEATPERPALILAGSDASGDRATTCLGNPRLDGVPWISLLDNDLEQHRVTALESGADDCIVKPFSAYELVMRVNTILRRSIPPSSACPETADLLIDTWSMKLLVHGTEVQVTPLEFRLVEYLARNRGQVFTRDILLDAVWGDMQFIAPRSVDACISRIREKIEEDPTEPRLLRTVRGVGYRLDALPAWRSATDIDCDCAACRTKVSALQITALSRMKVKNRPKPAARLGS